MYLGNTGRAQRQEANGNQAKGFYAQDYRVIEGQMGAPYEV